MKIAIIGPGGVGGYFGGRLAQAGQDVRFFGRAQHARAMREHGLRVDSAQGDFALPTVDVTDDPAALGDAEIVLLCVKTFQLEDVLAAVHEHLRGDCLVIPLLNSVRVVDRLRELLGDQRALGGACWIVSHQVEPGHIHHVSFPATIIFGHLDGHSDPRLDVLDAAFRETGVASTVADDIQVVMWKKFMFISGWAGIGAVTRAPIGVIRTLPETRALLVRAMEEVDAVARARGVALPADAVAQAMATIDKLNPMATASMQRDMADGKQSELFEYSGAMVELGKELGVPTPTHQFIFASALPQELEHSGQGA